MERPTTDIVTPVKEHKVKIYEYLTGREFEYCQEPLLEAMVPRTKQAVGAVAPSVEFGGAINTAKVREYTQRLIEKYVVDVDGNNVDVTSQVLDMHSKDYQFVVAYLQELSKKNSTTTTS